MTAELIAIRGPNFSGRTALLRKEPGLYLGPDASHFLSGIASTVREEIALGSRSSANSTLAEFGIDHLATRNPFTLSGGEQVLVALAAIARSGTDQASLDCCLEQVDELQRCGALQALRAHVPRLKVADNTMEQWQTTFSDILDTRRSAFGPPPPQIVAHVRRPFHVQPPCRLRVRGLSFGYERRSLLLNGAAAQFVPGHVILLEGSNGTGKSTLSKLLAGLLRPLSGTVVADNQVFSTWHRPGALVAYHHQDPDVQLFADTVRGELELSAGPVHPDFVDWAAEVFGLSALLASYPLDLPFVLRKRVALAATLARRCPWYILDEPTLGQDSQNSEQIAAILSSLVDQGAGVVVISHSSAFRSFFPRARRMKLAGGKLVEPA
jgi:energy-coupling factor transport system ATP-binding protein